MGSIIPAHWRVIFKIGELDFSPNEFALAPFEAKKFKEKFPQDPVYIVGRSKPSELPFIHPNEADTFWGGEPYHQFIIKFNIDKLPEEKPLLLIALCDVHEALAPIMDIFFNGELAGTFKIRAGKGRAFFGEKGEEQLIALPLKRESFRVGENVISIALHSGSWVAYDAILLLEITEEQLKSVKIRDYPFMLYREIAPFELRTNGVFFPCNEGYRFFLLQGDFVETNFTIDNGDFEIECDILVEQGDLEFSYTLPEEAMGNNWSFNLPESKKSWLHLYIHNFSDKVIVKLSDGEGKILKEKTISHPVAPYGRFRLTSLKNCEFVWANLFFRAPVLLSLDKFAYRLGDIAHLKLKIPCQGELDLDTLLVNPQGKVIDKRRIQLSPNFQELVEDFIISMGRVDGEYKIKCSLSFQGLSLWNGEISLTVSEKEAQKALLAMNELEKRENISRLAIREAKKLFSEGDFSSALSLLKRVQIKHKENKRYCLKKKGEIILGNDYFELGIKTEGGFGPFYLLDKMSGRLLADAQYLYFLNEDLNCIPKFKGFGEKNGEFSLIGEIEDVQIIHKFYLPDDMPYFEEQLILKNMSERSFQTPKIAFGFMKSLKVLNGKLSEGLGQWRAVAVPYRRPLQGSIGEYQDYPFEELLWRKGSYCPSWPEKRYTDELGAEGWVLTNGERSLLIAKYNNQAMEYSTLKIIEGKFLRFGGGGIWHNDPEGASELSPGEEIRFGTTRYILLNGDWKSGYYEFRKFMEEKGHKFPENYNPPIHWNELYDNPLWWNPDTPENRKKFYSLPQILEEAEKAQEIGCEALYLDPGWDTSFASSIWAEDRLLKAEEFVKLMKDKYNLLVSLHTPLAGWSDINAYPYECRRKDSVGNVLPALCCGSEFYIKTKAERLIELARAGVAFFMFDGSAFTGECYDIAHKHPIPYTREAHCRAILKLAQLIHERFANVLIELHDPVIAGVPERYAPTYYLHALPGSFDEVWAFEYMWDPMADLLSGRAISLYYYNLAYSIPLYIHIDLRKDNQNCLEFWWYASTCRHLGVGGKHPDEKVWEAHKKAMREYKRLKPFYTVGEFYGLDETVHIHSLRGKGAVINVFNFGDIEERKYICLKLEDIGLNPGAKITVNGAKWKRNGSSISLFVDVPAKGTVLLEVVQKPVKD